MAVLNVQEMVYVMKILLKSSVNVIKVSHI